VLRSVKAQSPPRSSFSVFFVFQMAFNAIPLSLWAPKAIVGDLYREVP